MIIISRGKTTRTIAEGAPKFTPPPPVAVPDNAGETATKIQNFFANPFMCDWPGCNDLHDAYQKEVDALNSTHCPPCKLGAVKIRYAQLIRNALSQNPT